MWLWDRGMAQPSTFSSSTGVRPSVRLPSKKRHPEFNLSWSGGGRQELVYHISSSDNALAMRDWKVAPHIKLIWSMALMYWVKQHGADVWLHLSACRNRLPKHCKVRGTHAEPRSHQSHLSSTLKYEKRGFASRVKPHLNPCCYNDYYFEPYFGAIKQPLLFYPAYVSDPDGLQFNIHLNESSEVDKHALSEEP